MQPDRLTLIARELAVLADSDRRAILAALDRDDRDQVIAAMRKRHLPSPAPVIGTHSAWFERLVLEARDDGSGALTEAARAALIDAADPDGAAAPQRAAPGRTLLQAAGGLLSTARAR